jgi:hypothetical protein
MEILFDARLKPMAANDSDESDHGHHGVELKLGSHVASASSDLANRPWNLHSRGH